MAATNPPKPVFVETAFDYLLTATAVDLSTTDVTLSPTNAPTASPTHEGYATVEVEMEVTVVSTALSFPLSATEAAHPVVQASLAAGMAASVGLAADKVAVTHVDGVAVSRMRRSLASARRLSEAAIMFSIESASVDPDEVAALKESVTAAAIEGSIVANVQAEAATNGVLLAALKEMDRALAAPSLSESTKMVVVVEQIRSGTELIVAPTMSPTGSSGSSDVGSGSESSSGSSNDSGSSADTSSADDAHTIPYSLNGGDVGGVSSGVSATTWLVVGVVVLMCFTLGCSLYCYCNGGKGGGKGATTGCDTPTEGGTRKLKTGKKYVVPKRRPSGSKSRRASREGALRVRTTADSDEEEVDLGLSYSSGGMSSVRIAAGTRADDLPMPPTGVSLERTASTDNVLTKDAKSVVQMGSLDAALRSTSSQVPKISGPPTPTAADAALPRESLSPAATATMARLATAAQPGQYQHEQQRRHEDELLQQNLQQQDLIQQQIVHRQRHLQHQQLVGSSQNQGTGQHRLQLPPLQPLRRDPGGPV
jgi:hypothetical protein